MSYKVFPTPYQNTTIDTDLGRCHVIELPLFAPGRTTPLCLPKGTRHLLFSPNHLLNASNPTTSIPSKPKPKHQGIPDRRERMGHPS